MRTVHLGFGANVEPARNARRALEGLAETVEVRAVSTVYRTPALKRPEDPDFLNAGFAIATDLDPHELKRDLLQQLEARAGRERGADPYAPRPLDLDILLDGDRGIDDELLTVPDPDLYDRAFLARPLLEIAGDVELPDTGRRLSAVADELDPGGMEAQRELTRELRSRVDEPAPGSRPDA